MATKAEPVAEEAQAPKSAVRSKKLLIIAGLVVLVLILAAVAGWYFLSRQHTNDGEEPEVAQVAPKGPPVFMPLENMVVNLADPGGEKVAQIGITFELLDSKSADKVKLYLPAIRSAILILISQRTSEELLQREGKEKLAADILEEAARPFRPAPPASVKAKVKKPELDKAKKKSIEKSLDDDKPVRGVLFSSFIVQ